eukprot:TRINITY_DN6571_c1_g2_i1.p1 TRINITY_DN6571_c1_g2~~TRINITY_DN6571_c1_g2_i1.p1  ORF type:complete len:452 (+),score=196.51 TRINITY_DN6571_c1_g2_i1:79-1356(+)
MAAIYPIKWVLYKGYDVGIVTQNENGPCPLIAICNILFLRRHIAVEPGAADVTYDELVEKVRAYVLDMVKRRGEEEDPNTQYAMNETLNLLPSLVAGMDINVKFGSITDCELGAGVCCFDLFGIKLVHGWLPSPDASYYSAVKGMSYNTLVEAVINKNDEVQKPEGDRDAGVVAAGAAAEEFMNESGGQLTYHGLFELTQKMEDDDLCVFFRNNHFSTLTKQHGKLYALLTDVGYQDVRNVVWETLVEIEGDNTLVDGCFQKPRDLGRQQRVFTAAHHVAPEAPPQPSPSHAGASSSAANQEAADAALAAALHQEEQDRAARRQARQQQQQQQQQQQAPPPQTVPVASAYPAAPYQQPPQQRPQQAYPQRHPQQPQQPQAGNMHPQERLMAQYARHPQQPQQQRQAKKPAKEEKKKKKDDGCSVQ